MHADASPEPLYPLALDHHRAGRLREAESLYRQILAANPNHADTLQMLGGIAALQSIDPESVTPENDPPPPFDVHCPLLSLPHLLGTTLQSVPADIPYIRAEPALAESWRVRLAHSSPPRPHSSPSPTRISKAGVAWATNLLPPSAR